MRTRLLHIAIGFAAAFALLAIADARVQIALRVAIAAHPGDPRHAESAASRGAIEDAAGAPLAFSKGDRRIYPAGGALAQLVGYSSPIYGDSGLEAALGPVLSGRDARPPSVLGPMLAGGHMGAAGDVVVTTLRADIAMIADAALPPGIRGSAVVLDPRTGSILAVVNRPTFDPNRLEQDWKSLRGRADAPLLDRGVSGLYPPGSTFKIVTLAAALDSGALAPDETFVDPGYFDVDGYRIHNDEGAVTGTQTLTTAFALSSNVDFAQIGMRVGSDDFYAYLRRFGVGEPTDLAIPVERDGVPAASDVSRSELAQMAFGQGSLAVTPLRMALVAAAIADGGVAMRPQLVREIRVPGGGGVRIPPATGAQAISAETADEVRSMMEAVVRYGTGTAAGIPGVDVAGKTGTATHPGGRPDAWFVCFAPANAPRLVVAVVVEDAGYGGEVAAPIARTILQGALPLYAR